MSIRCQVREVQAYSPQRARCVSQTRDATTEPGGKHAPVCLFQAYSSKVYTSKVTPCVPLFLPEPSGVTGLATSLFLSPAPCSQMLTALPSPCPFTHAVPWVQYPTSAVRMLTVGGEAESGQLGPCYCRGHQVRMLWWMDRERKEKE